jgi:hypothetical protein
MLFKGGWNGVDIGGVGRKRDEPAGPASLVNELLKKELRPLWTLPLNHGLKGLKPLNGLLLVHINAMLLCHHPLLIGMP